MTKTHGGPRRINILPGFTKYGRLTAVEELTTNSNGNRIILWECDCGTRITRRLCHVKESKYPSCGCYIKEQAKLRERSKVTRTRVNDDVHSGMVRIVNHDRTPYLNQYLKSRWS